ncbi:MAG: hypothetical protein J7M21_06460, partial [Planctomycetes bacterium]|nr:hypothetical protein [Planctomycetota bacterium]
MSTGVRKDQPTGGPPGQSPGEAGRGDSTDGPTGAGRGRLGPAGADADDLAALLAEHCRVAAAQAGAVLAVRPDGRVDILAVHPPAESEEPPADGQGTPADLWWLSQAVRRAGDVVESGRQAACELHEPGALYGEPAGRHVILLPVSAGRSPRGVVALVRPGPPPAGEPGSPAAKTAQDARRVVLDVPIERLYAIHLAA